MIKNIFGDIRSNIIYTIAVIVLLSAFGCETYAGSKYFPDAAVQKNAGYNGVVPHSGYGVRFYHK